MRLTRVEICNIRSIRHLAFDMEEITVLIGAISVTGINNHFLLSS